MTDEGRDETGRETVRPATERAEELVDRATQSASYLASLVFLRLLRGASLAREEAEDIWAEAQSLRRRERQGAEPGAGGGDNVAAPGVQQAAATAAVTVQSAAHQAAASVASAVEGATEAARRKAKELSLNLGEDPENRGGGRITTEDAEKRSKAEGP